MTEFQVRSKVWLVSEGQPFLGDGRFQLLEAVNRTGSINAAAKDLGISYRKAWSRLDAMDRNAPFALLDRQTGGKGGGATHLTPAAEILLSRFETLRDEVNHMVNERFTDIFAQQKWGSGAPITQDTK